MIYWFIFLSLVYQISLSARSDSIVSPPFISSNGNSLGSAASVIMAVGEKRRAQLFNLSPHSNAEQASAGAEKSEKGKVSAVHSE